MSFLTPEQSELIKRTAYEATYNPEKLFPIPRKIKRVQIGIENELPFSGFDLWNHYEVSWLNEKGKPIVAVAEIIYGCESINIIESKSMKLYFNTFNNTHFKDVQTVKETIENDLNQRLDGGKIWVNLIPLDQFKNQTLTAALPGFCLDQLDIDNFKYHADSTLLTTEEERIEESLYSDLLKSNCLVTNQPDWCTVHISYRGKKINHENLLRYIVSFRNDNEFHEQCIEKIFMEILRNCKPESLTVYGRSTRRGGLDINSYRSTEVITPQMFENVRLCRQ